ncbi:Beta-carotene isomerase D27, partial [Gracilaria domingensis]
TRVRDNAFGQFCISMFRSIMQPQIGWKSRRSGYDGLIEECRMLLARKGPQEQQRVVRNTLDTLFQAPHGPTAFRKHFSDKPGLNATVTPIFFQWLVGDCYTNRPEEGGYGVYIEKCRFLEESGCKGLCVNMCQQPTQRYFTDVLGLPVRMTPNYEDMSCQMTYGIQPLPIDEDPAVTGDCLENCKMSPSV